MLESRTHTRLRNKIQNHLNYKEYLEDQIHRFAQELDFFTIEYLKNELRVEKIIIKYLRKKLLLLA